MAGLKVNWADVIFDNIKKRRSTFLPYGAFLTFNFMKFKVDLKNEINVVSHFELFDYTVLLRMKIPFVVGQIAVGSSSSTLHDTQLKETLIPPPFSTGFGDAYYNSVTAQIAELKSGQDRLFEQHDQLLAHHNSLLESNALILKNQTSLMEQFHSLSLKFYVMYDAHCAYFNQFPPPSPPESDY